VGKTDKDSVYARDKEYVGPSFRESDVFACLFVARLRMKTGPVRWRDARHAKPAPARPKQAHVPTRDQVPPMQQWVAAERAKGRPARELTYAVFMREQRLTLDRHGKKLTAGQ
jgi:hypothetical protein